MNLIIGIVLLIIFCGSGTLFCIVYLVEAQTSGPWIATIICIIITCIVICCVRIEGMWSMGAALIIMGCSGLVQFIIISTIETPDFWREMKNDEWFIRLASGFFSQPLVCLFGYGISRSVEYGFESRARNLANKIEQKLVTQINALKSIESEISVANRSYKVSDNLVLLISNVADKTLENAYIKSREKKDSELLSQIAKVSSKNNFHIVTEGKTLSVIHTDIKNRMQDRYELLAQIVKGRFLGKDYKELKRKWKVLRR